MQHLVSHELSQRKHDSLARGVVRLTADGWSLVNDTIPPCLVCIIPLITIVRRSLLWPTITLLALEIGALIMIVVACVLQLSPVELLT